jgi:hypothetical protein
VTAIRRLLQHASRWPKELERLVAAYERALGLKDRNPFRKTLKRFQSWRSRNVEPHKDALVFLGTNSRPPPLNEYRMNSCMGNAWGSAVPSSQTKFQSETVMAEVCLGAAVAGATMLIGMGVAIPFLFM